MKKRVTKQKRIILFLLIMPSLVLSQNNAVENKIEAYLKEGFNQFHDSPEMNIYFNNLNWENKLSSKNRSLISKVIDLGDFSRYKEMETNVMLPVLVHRLKAINNRENLYRWEKYRKYLNETKTCTDTEYDQYLLASIDVSKLYKFNNHISHYTAIDDQILNALVIRQCRLLRNGQKQTVCINAKMLNNFHLNILEQSTYSKKQAIEQLTAKIANLGIVITQKEQAILEALKTYGKAATKNSLKIVKDTKALQTFSLHGKSFLLQHLGYRAALDLSKKEQKELVKYLNNKAIYDGFFLKQKYQIALITSNITDENLKICLNRIGI